MRFRTSVAQTLSAPLDVRQIGRVSEERLTFVPPAVFPSIRLDQRTGYRANPSSRLLHLSSLVLAGCFFFFLLILDLHICHRDYFTEFLDSPKPAATRYSTFTFLLLLINLEFLFFLLSNGETTGTPLTLILSFLFLFVALQRKISPS